MNPPVVRPGRILVAVLPAVLLLLTVLAGSFVLLERDRAATLDATRVAQGNLALGLEHDFLRNIDIYDLSLRAAASGLRLLGGTTERAVQDAILFDGAIAAQYFRPIVIADATGAVMHDAGATPPRVASVVGRPAFEWLRDHAGGGLLIGFRPRSLIDDTPFLSLARAVRAADGSFGGVVSGGLDLGYFRDIFSRFDLPPGAAISVVDAEGRLVAGHPDRDAGSTAACQVATERQLGTQPLFLVIATPCRAVFAGWRVRAWVTGGTLVAFTAVSAALLLALWRALRRRQRAERSVLAAATAAHADKVRLNTYVDQLADGILAVRRDAGGRFVHERLNAAAASMLDVAAADAIGRTAREVWPAGLGEFMEARWAECLAAGTVLHCERVQDTRAGARVLRFVIAPVGEQRADGTVGVELLLASVRDVTVTVDMEGRLRQAQRMEAVGQLTAGVAHDFNNMLQAQFGALELLVDEVADRPHACYLASLARNACEHGTRLTHSLLSFSRQQHLAPQAVPVAALFERLEPMLARVLGPPVDLRMVVEPGTCPPFADAAQLEAALLNLALNGRDAMPDGGVLRIEARGCRRGGAAGSEGEPVVLLVVSDTGQGMEPDVVARSCEPFFTTKGVGKGSGLGLSMVQGFVEQSGGTMRIASTPGCGTVVELALPCAPAGAEAPLGDAPPRERCQATGRVLLVDDVPEVLAVTAELLEDAGFDVTTARHGDEALTLLAVAERPFDILVTDYMMPGMDGGTLMRQACAGRPRLLALVVTGYTEIEMLDGLPRHVQVLHKPLRGDALARHISILLDNAREAPSRAAPLVLA